MKTILLSEIIKNQAIINVGCVGHVSNGKSTLVKQMTGIKTQKFKSEKERNCTINIGYGNCKIFYSKETNEYKFKGSKVSVEKDSKNNDMTLIHHISFVDCPGHENYMSNMLCGTSVIDMAFLVEAANAKTVPQPQTLEHCIVVQQANISEVVIIQNKCDLVKREELHINKRQIDDFIEDYIGEDIKVIPLIAQTGQNIEYVGEYLANNLNNYSKDINLPLIINIIRTFDINNVNTKGSDLLGGVLGGSIVQGILNCNDIIQISPGICKKIDNAWIVEPIFTKVSSICSEKNKMDFAIAGGLIGIGTLIDPAYTKGNNLIGHIISHPGGHLDIASSITIKYKSFRKVSKENKVLNKGEVIKIGILCKQVTGVIYKWNKQEKKIKIKLAYPCCVNDQAISIMKKIEGAYKIFSIGNLIKKECVFIDIPIPNKYIMPNSAEYILKNDIIKTIDNKSHDYDSMVENLNYKYNANKSINIPTPYFTRTRNGALQILHNYANILESINNNKDVISIRMLIERDIETDLICSIGTNEKNALLVHSKVKNTAIHNTLLKLINKYRCCQVCSGYQTYLIKSDRQIQTSCEDCKSINSIIK